MISHPTCAKSQPPVKTHPSVRLHTALLMVDGDRAFTHPPPRVNAPGASAGASGTSADLEGVAATGAHTPVLVCCFLKCLFCGRPLGPRKAARNGLLSLMRRPFRSSSGAWLPLHTKDILTCVRAVPRFRAEPEVFRSSVLSRAVVLLDRDGVDRVLRTQKPVVPPTHRVSKGLFYI